MWATCSQIPMTDIGWFWHFWLPSVVWNLNRHILLFLIPAQNLILSSVQFSSISSIVLRGKVGDWKTSLNRWVLKLNPAQNWLRLMTGCEGEVAVSSRQRATMKKLRLPSLVLVRGTNRSAERRPGRPDVSDCAGNAAEVGRPDASDAVKSQCNNFELYLLRH